MRKVNYEGEREESPIEKEKKSERAGESKRSIYLSKSRIALLFPKARLA